MAVGAGSTYRDAAAGVARERARRLRADPETGALRFTRHGLVMDWVEVFAPVVFEAHGPREWPASSSLLLDDLPFMVRDPKSGCHRIAFRVFCTVGYEAGRPKLWRLEAFTSKSQADWEAFLGALGGAPPRADCLEGRPSGRESTDHHAGMPPRAAWNASRLCRGVRPSFESRPPKRLD